MILFLHFNDLKNFVTLIFVCKFFKSFFCWLFVKEIFFSIFAQSVTVSKNFSFSTHQKMNFTETFFQWKHNSISKITGIIGLNEIQFCFHFCLLSAMTRVYLNKAVGQHTNIKYGCTFFSSKRPHERQKCIVNQGAAGND